MKARQLVFRVHAIQRMFQRGISVPQVRSVVESGEVVEQYPEDKPYPSRLLLGWSDERPLHVVVADNPESSENIVITTYEPTERHWEPGFRRRKS